MATTIIVSGAAGFVKRTLLHRLQARPSNFVIDSASLPWLRERGIPPFAQPVQQIYHIGSDQASFHDAVWNTNLSRPKVLIVDTEQNSPIQYDAARRIFIPNIYGYDDAKTTIISEICSDVVAHRPIALPANSDACISCMFVSDAVHVMEQRMERRMEQRMEQRMEPEPSMESISIRDLAARISHVANVRHRTINTDRMYPIEPTFSNRHFISDIALRRTLVYFNDRYHRRDGPMSHRHLFDRLAAMAESKSTFSAAARAIVDQQEGWLDPQIPPEILRAIYD